MASDSRAKQPKDHLCLKHWLLLTWVSWDELSQLDEGIEPSMGGRLSALEKARLCPRCRAPDDAQGAAAAAKPGRAGLVAIPAVMDAGAGRSARAWGSLPPPTGEMPPTHTRPARGGGWVIFGLPALLCVVVLGAVAVGLVMLGTAPGANAPQTRTSVHARPDVRAEPAVDVYVDELRRGECIARPIPEGDISMVKVGPCNQPHREEVYALFALPAGHFAGQPMVDKRGDAGCRTRFPKYVGIDYDASELDYFAVTPEFRVLAEDREVVCIVVDSERHTATLKGVRR